MLDEMLKDPRFLAVLVALHCQPHKNGWQDICPSCKEVTEKLGAIFCDIEDLRDRLASRRSAESSIEDTIEHLCWVDDTVTRYFVEVHWRQPHLFEDGSKPTCWKCGSTDIRIDPEDEESAVCVNCVRKPEPLERFHKKTDEVVMPPLAKQPDAEEDIPF